MKHSFKLILLLWSNKFLIRLSIISVLSAKSLKKGEIVGSNSKLYIAETETEKPNSLRMTFCHAQKILMTYAISCFENQNKVILTSP